MGGTGLEPVTPSLSSWFSGADDLSLFLLSLLRSRFEGLIRRTSTTYPRDVCAFFVRRLRARDPSRRRSTTSSAWTDHTSALLGAMRVLLLERRSAVRARTAALNQLSALVVTARDHVGERFGRLSGERLARAAARQRACSDTTNGVLRRLGRRVERLSQEVAEAERNLGHPGYRARTRSAHRARRWTRLRRTTARLKRRPEANGTRSDLRRSRRHQPDRRLQRKAATPPPQPPRPPPTQLGGPRDR